MSTTSPNVKLPEQEHTQEPKIEISEEVKAEEFPWEVEVDSAGLGAFLEQEFDLTAEEQEDLTIRLAFEHPTGNPRIGGRYLHNEQAVEVYLRPYVDQYYFRAGTVDAMERFTAQDEKGAAYSILGDLYTRLFRRRLEKSAGLSHADARDLNLQQLLGALLNQTERSLMANLGHEVDHWQNSDKIPPRSRRLATAGLGMVGGMLVGYGIPTLVEKALDRKIPRAGKISAAILGGLLGGYGAGYYLMPHEISARAMAKDLMEDDCWDGVISVRIKQNR